MNRSSWATRPWTGVYPATLCPFHPDEAVDEEGLGAYIGELARVEGVRGLTCNGHRGEVMSLRPGERARVTEVVRSAVDAANAETGRAVAGFVPELMVDLVHACLDGDLARAKAAQATVAPLARLAYNLGEPGCGAHQRMKVARWLMGRFPEPQFRRSVRALEAAAIECIRRQLRGVGYPVVR